MGKQDCWDEVKGGWNVACLYDFLVGKDRIVDELTKKGLKALDGVVSNDAGDMVLTIKGLGSFAVVRPALRKQVWDWVGAHIDIVESQVI